MNGNLLCLPCLECQSRAAIDLTILVWTIHANFTAFLMRLWMVQGISFTCVLSMIEIKFAFLLFVPMSSPTMPRLELCAALELSEQACENSDQLKISKSSVFLYTDSIIVLGYLSNTNKRFTRYVTRRVENILQLSDLNQWRDVSTNNNIAPRRQSITTLTNSCWLSGPKFLLLNEETPSPNLDVELPEVQETAVSMKTSKSSHVLHRFSDWFSTLLCTTRALSYVINAFRELYNKAKENTEKFISREPITH